MVWDATYMASTMNVSLNIHSAGHVRWIDEYHL